MADDRWLVVGLGNPGPGYAAHRHNLGYLVVDELARRMGAKLTRHRTGAHVAEGRLEPGGPRVVLAITGTFMNVSGRVVAALAKFYDLPLDRVVVVHDELDLPFDTVRLKLGGGPGGHNGVRDVIAAIGDGFVRVRIGIGRPPGRRDPADFVLSPFTKAEREVVPSLVTDAADATEDVIRLGLLDAQQKWHAPREGGEASGR